MDLIDKLKKIGFIYEDGKVECLSLIVNDYKLEVNLEDKKINYGNKITVNKDDALNASITENIVRLECITRLLRQGYKPEKIELEKTYKLGHKYKGYADIVIYKNNKTYMIVECKRDLKELEKEKNQMLDDGGQLFSYYQQDKSAEILVLYTSNFEALDLYSNLIIFTEDNYKDTLTLGEIYARWNKQFDSTRIFAQEFLPYNISSKPLSYRDLEDLNEKDSKIIFNQFQEILRHNVVSDKPNAFNKMMNLFLCKIVDEFEDTKQILDFQWLESDDEESFMTRLNDLYKKGMKIYFQKDLIDYTKDDIFKAAGNDPELLKMFNDLRLKKNNEFAFKEVFDNKTFIENTLIVKEIVMLLQNKRIRYSYKQQFLGDFFELLLNTSLKQEAGQFFTPIPIVRFILKSLPIYEIITNKINSGDNKFLPYTIDYAVGTGHFLTESMDWYDFIIRNNLLDQNIMNRVQREQYQMWQNSDTQYQWANEYIYGIEKDYRLIKSAKVSCFLNGDGDAVIINGDGLDNFKTSTDYKGKLKYFNPNNSKMNEQFDVLIANPPYSVNSFKNYLRDAKTSFELFDRITENSSEIECLFIERAYQLLKTGGVAGIILPSSILSNGKIYTYTRNILLKHFDIISIVSLGDCTFMETGTNTIILFLRKKDNSIYININNNVKELLNSPKVTDITINGIDHCISKYLKDVYNDIFSLQDYDLFLKQPEKVDNIISKQYLKKYEKEDIIRYEVEKLCIYLISIGQKVVIANTGDSKDEQVNFLGYSFSKRRKYEGMHKRLDENGNLFTKLYNETDINDSTKLNSYIYNNFNDNDFEIDSDLNENVDLYNLKDIIEFEPIGDEFICKISTTPIDKFKINSQYEVKPLGNLLIKEPIGGSTPSKENTSYWNSSDIPWVTLEDFENDLYITSSKKFVSNLALEDKKIRIVPKNSVLMSCTATLGKVKINSIECATNQQINALVCDEEQIIPEFLAYYLSSNNSHLHYLTNNLGVKHINLPLLKRLQVIVPPLDIQRKILKTIAVDKSKITDITEKVNTHRLNIIKTINQNLSGKYENLEDLCIDNGIKIGGTPASYEYKYYHNGENLWVKISDMSGDEIYDTAKKINDLGVKNSNVKLIKKGSPLISFKLTIGKTAIAGKDLYTNEAIMGLEPVNDVDNRFLFYLFKYNFVDMSADQKAFGKSLNLPLLKKLKIPYIYDEDVKIQLIDYISNEEYLLNKGSLEITKLSENIQSKFEEELKKPINNNI